MEQSNKGEINADTMFNMQRQILTDEIEDEEFLESAIENFSEMIRYILYREIYSSGFQRYYWLSRRASWQVIYGLGWGKSQK